MSKLQRDFNDWILFEDDRYLIINKPPGLSTLEDRNDPVNLLALARAYHGEAQVCHRLDKDTSGVLAIAKDPGAYRHLTQLFQHRQVTKIYHAIVDGIHRFENEAVDQPILKKSDGTVSLDAKGKASLTFFQTLEAYKAHCLVSCRPVTGRMHQIRIHLAYLGASISGDAGYGGKPIFLSQLKRNYNLKKTEEEQPLMKRMALHALSVTFNSLDDKEITVEAPYPKDFRVAVKQLSANR